MTAHATQEEKQRCLDAGMNDHVSKPIDPVALFETVGRFYKPSAEPDQPVSNPEAEKPREEEMRVSRPSKVSTPPTACCASPETASCI